MTDRKTAPAIKDAVDFTLKLPPYQHHTLRNGVSVYYLDLGEQDTLMVSWLFYAGNCFEEKNLVALATNLLLKNGTRNKDAFAINEHFEYYGSYLSRSCQHETAEITLHCLCRHFRELIPAVAELLTDSVFPSGELEILRKNMQQRLEVNLKKSEFVAGRLIDAYLFGENHPYGKYSSREGWAALEQEEILQFYTDFYTQGRCLIFAAGKLPEGLVPEIESAFGGLPLKGGIPARETFSTPFSPAREKKYRISNDPDSMQGAIRLARPFPNRHHPDFQKMQVLNTVFGGFFGSRLMANIREDKGYTYGIHSYLLNLVQDSGLQISTEAGKEVCEATIREVYEEMRLLREEPVDGEELHTVRNFMIGNILGDLDGPFQVAGRWKNILLNGLDENYFNQSIRTIKTITPEELRALANTYLQPADFYELVVV
jgi:zinc protease